MSDLSNPKTSKPKSNEATVNLARQKIDAIYKANPAEKEDDEATTAITSNPSKHQAYMKELTDSGMSLAQIQTSWHNYYVGLDDKEKHQVWTEFYSSHDSQRKSEQDSQKKVESVKVEKEPVRKSEQQAPKLSHNSSTHKKASGPRKVHHIKEQLLSGARASAAKKLKTKQHFQSLLFGVGMGLTVVLVMLFGFFNDRFIAPFISPSRAVSSTPILIDSGGAVGPESKIIIPKINVEIPVVYDEPSVEEEKVQAALERGVLHYATTPNPGEQGNSVFFGHSSNNILNRGQYKFAFVLLNRLEIGDTFYLNKDGVRYAYKIYEKRIVSPTEVDVLNSTSKPATATLITCDPPGTTINRLIVIGEQISPDPTGNKESSAVQPDSEAAIIPSNAPSLWQRIVDIF